MRILKIKIKWGRLLQPIPRAIKEEARLVKRGFGRFLKGEGKSGLLFLYLEGDLLAKISFGFPTINLDMRDSLAKNIVPEMQNPIISEEDETVICIVFNFNLDLSLLETLSRRDSHKQNNLKVSTISRRQCGCGAKEGTLHKYGCLFEICPRCLQRLSRCQCPFQKDLPLDDWQQTLEGAIPQQHIRIPV